MYKHYYYATSKPEQKKNNHHVFFAQVYIQVLLDSKQSLAANFNAHNLLISRFENTSLFSMCQLNDYIYIYIYIYIYLLLQYTGP